ncbi:MAG: GAF domain-containing protein [Anaerolineae bacterium]|nr:GAF domain-containing protein [Anaerolineae bacterium]
MKSIISWKQLSTQTALEPGSLEGVQFRYVQVLVLVALVTSVVGLAAQLLTNTFLLPVEAAAGGILGLGLAQLLIARRYLLAASTVSLVTFTALAVVLPTHMSILLAVLALISAAVLANNLFFIVANVVVFSRLVLVLSALAVNSDSPLLPVWVVMFLSLIFISVATRYFMYAARKATWRSQYSEDLLRATAALGQSAVMMRDMDLLLDETVNFICEKLDMYHAQVFLVDENRDYAVLHSSTGEAGKELLARKHQLPVDKNSVVGQAAADGSPAVVLDTRQNQMHRFNEVLPKTRSEVAVPIMDGDQVMGVLDVQRARKNAFVDADLMALQAIATDLAIALRSVRLVEEKESYMLERERLVQESETNWREIHRLNREMTRAGWMDYVSQKPAMSGVTLQGSELRHGAAWSASLLQAGYDRQPVVTSSNGNSSDNTVAVPVMLRGEVIGVIGVEVGGDRQQDEVVEMVSVIAERLAVSLENARLFEESQASTAQEHQINQIVTRYQEGVDVNDLLRITLSELSENLGAQRGAIRLGVLPAQEEGAS